MLKGRSSIIIGFPFEVVKSKKLVQIEIMLDNHLWSEVLPLFDKGPSNLQLKICCQREVLYHGAVVVAFSVIGRGTLSFAILELSSLALTVLACASAESRSNSLRSWVEDFVLGG